MTTERDPQTRLVLSWLREEAHENPERMLLRALDEVDTTPQRRSWWPARRTLHMNRLAMAVGAQARSPRSLASVAAAGLAIVVVVAGAVAWNFYVYQHGIGAASPSPTILPSPSGPIQASASWWPQSTLDEVRAAQQLADAGDPDYAWQIDPQLAGGEGEDWDKWAEHFSDPGAQIAERFLRDELGWDTFLFNIYPTEGLQDDGGFDGVIRSLVYSRCAPGETNDLYPIVTSALGRGADRCAPTIDDLHYETVSVDLSQPDRRGPGGIWVVTGWTMLAPFAQADTRVIRAAAEARLGEFLQARVDGAGAEGYVTVSGLLGVNEVPLLYATTTGARYERFEFELLGAQWPVGDVNYVVRLFADNGATVVEQPIEANFGNLSLDPRLTTENGRPVPQPFIFMDGKLTVSAPRPWDLGPLFDRGVAALVHDGKDEERIQFLDDPHTVSAVCAPDLSAATIAALADAIRFDTDLVTTTPVAVTLAGLQGLSMDITATPGASVCPDDAARPALTREVNGVWRGLHIGAGSRMRLYLLAAPEGSSIGILAIAIMAPEARFEAVLADATPIIETVEIHAP